VIGGPKGDAGMSGRIDHRRYVWRNGAARRGFFFGKDPTKVDRSAAYAARYIAKNVVAAGLADNGARSRSRNAIGVARPYRDIRPIRSARPAYLRRQSLRLSGAVLHSLRSGSSIHCDCDVRSTDNSPPMGIFGRADLDLPWERTDSVKALQSDANAAKAAPKASS